MDSQTRRYDAGEMHYADALRSPLARANRPLCHPPHSRPHALVQVLFKKVGSDCLVGEGFTCGDKSSIKKSVVGKHCSVGNNVKLVGCILLDHVTIADECQLTGYNCVALRRVLARMRVLGQLHACALLGGWRCWWWWWGGVLHKLEAC